ncbi:HNH endonuclease signature motif containing protein [Streptomyces sp. ISL-1]|uniref:HNH endonuclease signature motif containing protein n=1 Tax=Streptomyces sp. ISL-1 TaxID=2817657 RepID=UPI002034DE87|nr:HNH endonuclease signature motif containing protein [Streptomyces sp. ISL-1]
MRVRVGMLNRLAYGDTVYGPGDEFDIPDEAAGNWLRTGMVSPVEPLSDAEWIALVTPEPKASAPDPAEYAKPLVKPGKAAKSAPRKRKAGGVCAQPGCPEFVPDGGKCPAHRRVSSTTGERYRSSQREVPKGRRTAFARLSRAFLREHPICAGEQCDKVNPLVRNAATETHHIDGLGLAGPRWNDESNWLACCKSCHAVYTGRDFGFGSH